MSTMKYAVHHGMIFLFDVANILFPSFVKLLDFVIEQVDIATN